MLHSISCSQRSFVHVELPSSQLKQPKTTFWFSAGIEGLTLTNHSPWFPLEGGSFLKPGRSFPEHQQVKGGALFCRFHLWSRLWVFLPRAWTDFASSMGVALFKGIGRVSPTWISVFLLVPLRTAERLGPSSSKCQQHKNRGPMYRFGRNMYEQHPSPDGILSKWFHYLVSLPEFLDLYFLRRIF